MIEKYLRYLAKSEIELDKNYHKYIDELNEGFRMYYILLRQAFPPNYEETMRGSSRASGIGNKY